LISKKNAIFSSKFAESTYNIDPRPDLLQCVFFHRLLQNSPNENIVFGTRTENLLDHHKKFTDEFENRPGPSKQQGCQIFLGTTNQTGEKYGKFQMTIKCTKLAKYQIPM
jgi:hypothetical protein